MEARARTKGEVYEGLAFTFCKIATVVLITQRFALLTAAAAAAVFFTLAYRYGKTDTRCVARYPLAIAAFWTVVAVVAAAGLVRAGAR
jgi:hypothetical protein